MKKALIVSLLLLPALLMAQDASKIVNNLLKALEEKSIQADFTITILTDNQPMTYTGKGEIGGEKFYLSALGMQIAYDGKTLYTYQEDINELTLTHPTLQELAEVNPLFYIKALCASSAQQKATSGSGQDAYTIDFIPTNNKAGILKYTLSLDANYLPTKIVIKENTAKNTTIRFKNTKLITKAKCTVEAPKAIINDFR